VGIVAALLLFISVLVHELSHSFVAKGRGLPVQGITLFIFGGVSNLRGEARRAWDEFAIAIVGPLTSAVLAGVFWGLTFLVTDPSSPLAAILSYLAIINGLVAAFNLLPGFPLDGGRVLRSILWGGTGSLVKATNIAAMVGRILGWALIGWGVFRILQGDLLGGLWTAFIGWFLSSIADASRKEVVAQEIFQGVRVGDVMDPEPEAVSPGMTVDEIVTECFLRRGRRAVPVCDESGLIGIVSLSDISPTSRRFPRKDGVAPPLAKS
jgi:Zn-dependent protease